MDSEESFFFAFIHDFGSISASCIRDYAAFVLKRDFELANTQQIFFATSGMYKNVVNKFQTFKTSGRACGEERQIRTFNAIEIAND